ncbi:MULTISPECIES: membrane protein insertase YidC [Tsukamurella]|uniref:Membrane protein insertase YidC n=2 Tax=Tsukamurella TaxID=2060 RepID=A0A5C5RXQ3_9ACTN|nr:MULTISPECIES: membrane protein insertase YidC [Tsukamurella]NMD57902.1 membrane protein insertase YidC [Tsukamurella columbiensis]TWS27869.1 membrane protein insertase YidC [Tsukamurella conjunctivitidis]
MSLDYVYYPVSGIMWVWHKVFSFVPGLGPDSGITWALSVIFLVLTLRAILYKPFVRQIRTTRQMQEFQPQMQALRKKYGKDRQKLALEMQKLQKEHGFNPLLGCLPALLQVPVFIGLFHVLRSFNRMNGGATSMFGSPDMTAYETRHTPNYFFSATDVGSFLDARLFDVPLSSMVQMPEKNYQAFMPVNINNDFIQPNFEQWQILALSLPLMIIAALATHFNSRASIARQPVASLDNPQTAIMNRLMLWVFPIGVLVGGFFLPVAILIYWVTQNIWTYCQQHIVFGKLDKEDEEKKRLAQEKRAENAPKPGVKPKKGGAAVSVTKAAETATDATDEPAEESAPSKPTPGAKPKPQHPSANARQQQRNQQQRNRNKKRKR